MTWKVFRDPSVRKGSNDDHIHPVEHDGTCEPTTSNPDLCKNM